MRKAADVVIIGGGVIGASVAYHLCEEGYTDVVILEREAAQGLGSTGKATGGVRAQFTTPVNIQMSLYSLDFFKRFEEATGVDPGYRPRGYLFLASTQDQLDQLRSFQKIQHQAGLDDVEIIDAHSIAQMIPQIRTDDIAGGAFRQQDGFIDPLSVMKGFTQAALHRGTELLTETTVTGIRVETGRVTRVETNKGEIATPAVVNAAGAWAAQVARMARVDLGVTPLRRQALGVSTSSALPTGIPMTIDLGTGFHFRPYPAESSNNFLFLWPDPSETSGFKTEYDQSFNEKVLALARNRARCFENVAINNSITRCGLYEMTADHHAIIDRAPGVEGLFFVNGFSGHGVMHSPAAGRMAADIIMNGRSGLFEHSALSVTRFTNGPTIHERTLI
jgi:sarcosine oxidase subunit beta